MRSLADNVESLIQPVPAADTTTPAGRYGDALIKIRRKYHARCLFNRDMPIADLKMTFADNGDLHGSFQCDARYEGYDGMVHGGVLAAIIDASMTQCLMGHGIAGYTAELSVRYRKPVLLNRETGINTRMFNERFKKLCTLETAVTQGKQTCVTANARFLKISR
jgi:acyl-coenzyme A thioesterase PaaI-like protein